LANDLGNLASRTLKMIENYFDGKIPGKDAAEAAASLETLSEKIIELYRESFGRFEINKALDHVWALISAVNRHIVVNEPWAMVQDASKRSKLAAVLYDSAEALRIIAILAGPVLPDGAARILEQLGVPQPLEAQEIARLSWGGLKSGTPVGPIKPVYPRIDGKEFLGRVEAYKQTSQAVPAAADAQAKGNREKDRIAIDDFTRVEMRVGKIVSAEPVPKSEKLVKLQVNIGTEVRQVVAGIARDYPPEALPGRLVVVVTNLKPTKLMGIESNGMIVAASEGGRPILATFTEPVEIGSRLT
jgi:methionyl-tRNA synthetase